MGIHVDPTDTRLRTCDCYDTGLLTPDGDPNLICYATGIVGVLSRDQEDTLCVSPKNIRDMSPGIQRGMDRMGFMMEHAKKLYDEFQEEIIPDKRLWTRITSAYMQEDEDAIDELYAELEQIKAPEEEVE